MADIERPGRATAAQGAAVVVTFCFLAAMCEGMDVQSAGVAAAGISHDLKPTPGQLGVFFAAANVGLIVGALIGGRLADRIGRKPVLTASILLFGVCSILTGLAGDMSSLTWARLLTGLGLGGAMPNLIALVADVTADRSRNATIATTYIGMPVGGAIAGAIVLALTPDHWRQLFLVGGAAPLLIGLLMILFLPNPRRVESKENPHAGRIAELFEGGRLSRTLVLWAGFFLAALTLHLMLNWLPLLLQGRGLAKSEAAIAQIAFSAVGAAAALVAGLVLDTRWRLLSVSLTVAAIPLALVLVANAPAEVVTLTLAAGFLGGAIIAAHVILYGVAGACYPTAIRGTGMGAVVGASRLGALAGPTLAAILLTAGKTPTEVLTSLLPVVLGAGVCVGWLGWPRARPGLEGGMLGAAKP